MGSTGAQSIGIPTTSGASKSSIEIPKAGFSSVKESKLWWKEQWSTKAEPPFEIAIAQANRTNGRAKGEDQLPGIVSVGLSITSAEN